MRCLPTMIANKNAWALLTNRPSIDYFNLTQENADFLFQSIDSELSPENLHCDGEISREAAQEKYEFYVRAYKELLKLGFSPSEPMYSI